jgi:hypothetical protein
VIGKTETAYLNKINAKAQFPGLKAYASTGNTEDIPLLSSR